MVLVSSVDVDIEIGALKTLAASDNVLLEESAPALLTDSAKLVDKVVEAALLVVTIELVDLSSLAALLDEVVASSLLPSSRLITRLEPLTLIERLRDADVIIAVEGLAVRVAEVVMIPLLAGTVVVTCDNSPWFVAEVTEIRYVTSG